MLFFALLAAIMATMVSTTAAQVDSPFTFDGVIFFTDRNYGGESYQLQVLEECNELPDYITRDASSIEFHTEAYRIVCDLYSDGECSTKIYTGLEESTPDLQIIEADDAIAAVKCIATPQEAELGTSNNLEPALSALSFNMHLFTLLTTALATAVSATETVERITINARDTVVTFYDEIYYNAPIFTIPNLDECFNPPDELMNKASSILFEGDGVKCDLYSFGLPDEIQNLPRALG
ncbi:hypothetical protein V492_08325 [Pseudogymnoascus sp. VKM F-4246]|nr:hypothetical protein V492_08325 [Pseudogymnoascus sp. VKM F-4246]